VAPVKWAAPIKQRWRKKLRRFIKLTTLKYYNPKQVKVLCLPGSTALEIYQIYDRLGIPRRNIYAVEKDPLAYEKLKLKRLGVNLYFGDVYDVVHDTLIGSENFHIISLDFCGYFKLYHLLLLGLIFHNELLLHRGTLALNFLAMREGIIEQNICHRTFDFYIGQLALLIGALEKDSTLDELQELSPVWGKIIPPDIRPRIFKSFSAEEIKYCRKILEKAWEKALKNVPRDAIDLLVLNSAIGITVEILLSARATVNFIENDNEEAERAFLFYQNLLTKSVKHFLSKAMLATKIERYIYRNPPSVMKTTFFHLVNAKKYYETKPKTYTEKLFGDLFSYVVTYSLELPKMLPPIKIIPQPKPPKPSKKEVIEAIKKGMVQVAS